MISHRGRMRILAVAMVLALTISLMTPFTKEADAGYTLIPFLAVGGGFSCTIFVINFYSTATTMTIDSAIATRLINTTNSFALAGFEGLGIDCTGLLGVGYSAGTHFLSVFLYDLSVSLPPQAFGFFILPSSLGGGFLVPPTMFLFS